jgi:hypothetical protein
MARLLRLRATSGWSSGSFSPIPAPAVDAGQVDEGRRQLDVVGTERGLLDGERPLEHHLRIVQLSPSQENDAQIRQAAADA